MTTSNELFLYRHKGLELFKKLLDVVEVSLPVNTPADDVFASIIRAATVAIEALMTKESAAFERLTLVEKNALFAKIERQAKVKK